MSMPSVSLVELIAKRIGHSKIASGKLIYINTTKYLTQLLLESSPLVQNIKIIVARAYQISTPIKDVACSPT